MRVLVDIIHPAHVHFFKNPIRLLRAQGHDVLVTSRDKDCTLALLDGLGLAHECLSRQSDGLFDMAHELVARDRALARVARRFEPDVMTGIGGVCAAQVGRWLGVKSVVFYDTENATLQNALTYPFATAIIVPECYGGWTPRAKTRRYRGYHELSYLHPAYFIPDYATALSNGLAPAGDTFFIRIVSWRANHDIGIGGWSHELLRGIVTRLDAIGSVVISSEGPLPDDLAHLRYQGDPAQVHHVLAYCRAYVGESATMASEAVVLGVPALYAASVSRGYIDEQASRFGLAWVSGIDSQTDLGATLDALLEVPTSTVRARHQTLLDETVDVAAHVADVLEQGGIV